MLKDGSKSQRGLVNGIIELARPCYWIALARDASFAALEVFDKRST